MRFFYKVQLCINFYSLNYFIFTHQITMLRLISRKFVHTCQAHYATTGGSALAKLRKSTGYSVANCKKALDLFAGDASKAEEWLHAEAKQQGWTKWAKVQARSATQGVVGVFSDNKLGVMVEVNCETDFVAKNSDFHHFVENVIMGCIDHIKKHPLAVDVTKVSLDEMQLNQLNFKSSPLSELVQSAVLKFNEKTVLKRAVCVKLKEDVHLCSVSHPGTPCPNLSGGMIGKYGTLLAYKSDSDEHRDTSLNICQHVIGMNPALLGELTEQDILGFSQQAPKVEVIEDVKKEEQSEEDDESDHKSHLEDVKADSEEKRLLFQPYLLDPTISVGQALHEAKLQVLDFVRFECGEDQLVNEDEVKIKQSATA